MNKRIILVVFIITSLWSNAQCWNFPCAICPQVDSVKTNYFSNPPTIHVFGKFDYSGGFWLNNVISYEDANNTVVIDFYWAQCNFGFIGTLQQYDYTYDINFNHIPQFDIRINHIIDTLPWFVDSTICVFNNWPDTCLMTTYFFPYGYNVSLSETSISNFSVSPNPVKDRLKVQNFGNEPIQSLVLMDMMSKELKRQLGNGSAMDVDEFPSGTYFLQVESERGVWREKIILHR